MYKISTVSFIEICEPRTNTIHHRYLLVMTEINAFRHIQIIIYHNIFSASSSI